MIRKALFWIHLAVGLTVGLFILNMSVTGILMAFEPQIVAFAERDVRQVPLPSDETPRLGTGTLLARVREAFPDAQVAGLTVRADPSASVVFNLGREAGSVYV